MFKKLQKVTIKENAVGLNAEHRKFAGKDAVVLQVDGDKVVLAIDHDNNPATESIIITVKTKYVEVVSFLWQIWLLVRGIFKK